MSCTSCFPSSCFSCGSVSWLVVNSPAGVYPLFRCNAADLAGAAVRVHVSLASTPAALPRAPCAEECSSSEDEGTGETPALSQQASDKQQVDVTSSGITNGKAHEEDVMFLENTVAVSILVERAMHLSLKGNITHTPLSFLSFFLVFLFSFLFPVSLFSSEICSYSSKVNGRDGFWTWLHGAATPITV